MIQIVGFVVKAQERFTLPLPKGKKPPRVRSVSPRYTVRSAAEEFRDIYAKASPGDNVWVDDVQKPAL